MSRWDDRFSNHNLFPAIEKCREAVARAREVLTKHLPKDGAAMENLDRAEALLNWTERAVHAADRYLVPFSLLNQLFKAINHGQSELSAFLSNKNPAHLDSLVTHLETTIVHAWQLPKTETQWQLSEAAEAASQFRKSISRQAEEQRQRVDELQREVARVQDLLKDTGQEIQSQKGRLDEAISDFQKQSSEVHDEHRKEGNETLRAVQTKAEKQEGDRYKAFQAKLAEIEREQQDGLDRLGELKTKAENLVHAAAGAALAEGFHQVANKHRREGIVWQVIAVIGFGGLVFAQLWHIPGLLADLDPWQSIAMRTILSLGFLGLAGYGAAQARRAHRLEETNRTQKLELAAFEPFISSLPDEVKNKLREEAARLYFAGNAKARSSAATASGSTPPSENRRGNKPASPASSAPRN